MRRRIAAAAAWLALCLSAPLPARAQDAPLCRRDEGCVLVFKVEAKEGVTQRQADQLAGLVATTLAGVVDGVVETLADARRRIEAAGERADMRNCTEFSCLAELGNALGVPLFVSGDAGRLGNTWTLNLAVARMADNVPVGRAAVRAKGDLDALVDALDDARLRPLVNGIAGLRLKPPPAPPPETRPTPPPFNPRPTAPADPSTLQARCAAGDAAACTAYAMATAGSMNAQAFGAMKMGCDGGNPLACSSLARAYFTGTGTARNDRAGVAAAQRACDADFAEGCRLLGDAYAAGRGVTADPRLARQLYDRACRTGDSEACDAANEPSPLRAPPPAPQPTPAQAPQTTPAAADPLDGIGDVLGMMDPGSPGAVAPPPPPPPPPAPVVPPSARPMPRAVGDAPAPVAVAAPATDPDTEAAACDNGNDAACINAGTRLHRAGRAADALTMYERGCRRGSAAACAEGAAVAEATGRPLVARRLAERACRLGVTRFCRRGRQR